MASFPGAPTVPDHSKDNTLRAPFPRTNTTVKSSPSIRRLPSTTTTSSSSPANKSIPVARTKELPNKRVAMPNSLPGPRRNERFDQLFYTSPIPRSISRAYNSLQAAAPARGVTRTTATVPSSLRMDVMTDGVNGDGAMLPLLRKAEAPARAVVRQKVGVDGVGLVRENPTRRTWALANGLPSTSPAGSSPAAMADIPVSMGSPAPLVRDDAVIKDVSDEKQRDSPLPKKQGSMAIGGTAKGNVAVKVLIQSVKRGSKRSDPDPPPPTPPKKMPRTDTSSSPGQVRGTRQELAAGSRALLEGAQNLKPGPKVKSRKSVPKAKVQMQKERLEPSSSLLRNQDQPNDPVTEPPSQPPPPATAPKRERPKKHGHLRSGFEVPPGILNETGSLWDPASGRRLSRRVSGGFLPSPRPTSAPASAAKQSSKNSNPAKQEQLVSSDKPPSSAVSHKNKHRRISLSGTKEAVKEHRRPTSSAGEQVKRSTRNSLGSTGKEKQTGWTFRDKSASSSEASTTPRNPTRSSLTSQENEKTRDHEKSLGNKTTTTTPSKPQQQQQQNTTPIQSQSSPNPPPTPPPLPLKKPRRSIRNSTDLASFPPAGQNQPLTAETQDSAKKTGLARSWIVNETPRSRVPNSRVTRAAGLKMANLEFEFSDDE